MISKQRNLRLNWMFTMLFMVVGSLAVILVTVILYFSIQDVVSDEFYKFYINEKNNDSTDIVNNWIVGITQDSDRIREDFNYSTKYKISNIAQYLESLDYDKNDTSEVILEAEKLFGLDPNFLYFIIDSKGNMLRSGTDNSIDGSNLYDARDRDGKYFIREMIEATKNPDGLYVSYMWPKVKDGEPLLKTSFVKYMDKYDLIIGTGAYEEDVIQELKLATYKHIQSFYEGEEEYVFIIDFDGTIKVHGDVDLVDGTLSQFIDANGTGLHQMFMDETADTGEALVAYEFYKTGEASTEDHVLSEKVSYIRRIDDWNCYLGYGFHTDDINAEMSAHADRIAQTNTTLIVILVLVLISVNGIVVLLVRRGMVIQREILKNEEFLFEHLFNLINEATIITTFEGDVWYLNGPAQTMFGEKCAVFAPENSPLFYKTEKGTYKYVTTDNRVYFLEIEKDTLVYHETDGYIYFIKDVTEYQIEQDKLVYMALYDALTSLPNRRKLINDLQDLHASHGEYNQVVLGIIDLDYFKSVNDNYGHSVGDEVLKLFGQTFEAVCRSTDAFYRYGGEEFFLVLKDVDAERAIIILEKVKERFIEVTLDKVGFKVTFSSGLLEVDCGTCDFSNFDELFKTTDELLYKAKESGRNCIKWQQL